jgi:hypothetical protein
MAASTAWTGMRPLAASWPLFAEHHRQIPLIAAQLTDLADT